MLKKSAFQLIVLVFVLVISCEQKSVNEAPAVIIEPKAIDSILEKVFLNDFPSYGENTLARELALESLLAKVDSTMPLGYFNDIPMKVWYVKKNPFGEGAMIHFFTTNEQNSKDLLSSRLNFDLVGFFDEKKASTIKENETYFIRGKNFNRIDATQVDIVLEKVKFKKEPELTRSTNQDYTFNLGTILFEIDSLIPKVEK